MLKSHPFTYNLSPLTTNLQNFYNNLLYNQLLLMKSNAFVANIRHFTFVHLTKLKRKTKIKNASFYKML